MADHEATPMYTTCPACGKRSFLTRKDARAYARKVFPSSRMTAYACRDAFDPSRSWHVGHLGPSVRAGRRTREDWINRNDRRR